MPSALTSGIVLTLYQRRSDSNSQGLSRKGVSQLAKLRLPALKKPESLLPQAGPYGDSPHLLLRGKNLREERQMWKTYGKNQSFFKAQPLQKL